MKKGIYRLDIVVMNQNEEVVINGYANVKKCIKSLEDCVKKALRQIEEKRYDTVLVDAGIASSRIMHLGIGFDGKRVLVSSE